MSASTAPSAKQAILDLLIARPALNEVAITWGEPTEQEDLANELIFFDGPVTRRPEWREIGGPNSPLWEEYDLTLEVRNYTPGDDRAGAEQRCWVLIDEIEQAVRADLRLGDILRTPLNFGEQQVHALPESDGFSAAGFVPLICTSRI